MRSIGRSRTGKLIIGGCGTQIGMLVTFGSLTGIILLCGICATLNLASIGLRQAIAQSPTATPAVQRSASSTEVRSLLNEINSVLREIELIQANAPLIGTFTEASFSTAAPVVTANQSDVSLLSGPGADYHQVGVLPGGQSLEIVGRSSDSGWWLVSTPDGRFAWVAHNLVTAANLNDTIPIVTTPSQLGQPAANNAAAAFAPPVTPSPTPPRAPILPPGTPTPAADAERQYVEDMPSYQRVKWALLTPPVNASISPDGSKIALTERIKLYTITTEGAHTDIWLEDNEEHSPIGVVVWSPDGKYIAFVVGFKNPNCGPCRSVALLRVSDGLITYLEGPDDMETDAPRWTQDGRLLINVHAGEPADGVAYVYDISGHGTPAEGVYLLSSSHEGQKWYPWRPGRIWRAGVSERADSYNSD